jgi:hypothetical protein
MQIENEFSNFKTNFYLGQDHPNHFQELKNRLLDIVINLRELEYRINKDIENLRSIA